MNKSYAYKLNYTLWDSETNQSRLIQNDTVSYSEPKDHSEIMTEVWRKWQLIKGDNVQVGNMDIIIMSV